MQQEFETHRVLVVEVPNIAYFKHRIRLLLGPSANHILAPWMGGGASAGWRISSLLQQGCGYGAARW